VSELWEFDKKVDQPQKEWYNRPPSDASLPSPANTKENPISASAAMHPEIHSGGMDKKHV